jgi:hypothetical protein
LVLELELAALYMTHISPPPSFSSMRWCAIVCPTKPKSKQFDKTGKSGGPGWLEHPADEIEKAVRKMGSA